MRDHIQLERRWFHLDIFHVSDRVIKHVPLPWHHLLAKPLHRVTTNPAKYDPSQACHPNHFRFRRFPAPTPYERSWQHPLHSLVMKIHHHHLSEKLERERESRVMNRASLLSSPFSLPLPLAIALTGLPIPSFLSLLGISD